MPKKKKKISRNAYEDTSTSNCIIASWIQSPNKSGQWAVSVLALIGDGDHFLEIWRARYYKRTMMFGLTSHAYNWVALH